MSLFAVKPGWFVIVEWLGGDRFRVVDPICRRWYEAHRALEATVNPGYQS